MESSDFMKYDLIVVGMGPSAAFLAYELIQLNNYKNVGFIAEKNMLDLLDKDGIFNKIKYKDYSYIYEE